MLPASSESRPDPWSSDWRGDLLHEEDGLEWADQAGTYDMDPDELPLSVLTNLSSSNAAPSGMNCGRPQGLQAITVSRCDRVFRLDGNRTHSNAGLSKHTSFSGGVLR
jgi:hypothetical protein